MDIYEDELYHHGILGMKWGVRRYQNYDGTYTQAGLARYRDAVASGNKDDIRAAKKNLKNSYKYDKKIDKYSRDGGKTIDNDAVYDDFTKKTVTALGLGTASTAAGLYSASSFGDALSMISKMDGQSVSSILKTDAGKAAVLTGSALVASVAGIAASRILKAKANKDYWNNLDEPDTEMKETLKKYNKDAYDKRTKAAIAKDAALKKKERQHKDVADAIDSVLDKKTLEEWSDLLIEQADTDSAEAEFAVLEKNDELVNRVAKKLEDKGYVVDDYDRMDIANIIYRKGSW